MHTTDGGGVVSIQQNSELQPEKLQLLQNYPNPFNPSTVISWQLAARNPVKLTLYNLRGQLIAVLLDELQDVGSHQLRLDGRKLASGIYFYRLQTGHYIQTRKMILMK
ncbi:MAG: T9SS type A sorting domain-containing protein [Calditrichae bacterium]|nr:T9SS type A sorting domain-containing protein [Calditrichia bacterium]